MCQVDKFWSQKHLIQSRIKGEACGITISHKLALSLAHYYLNP